MTDTSAAPPADPWSLTTDQISAMTPAEAGATLAKMQDAINPPAPLKPADAQDARARLDKLTADKSFADRLLAGGLAEKKEFEALIAAAAPGDDVGDAIANIQEPAPLFETTTAGQLNRRDLASVVDTFRDAGLSDGAIGEALNGGKVTHREVAATRALQTSRHGDAAWRARFLANDWSAVREQWLINTILTSEVIDAGR
jgi:hypothetical protein